MHKRVRRLCRLAVVSAATLAVFGFTGCDKPTPTEPSHPSAFEAHVTISATPGVSPNTITITYDGCDCAPGTLIIRIDGVDVGTMSCGGSQSFALAPGRHTLAVVSHQGSVSADMSISREGPGLLAVITCHRR